MESAIAAKSNGRWSLRTERTLTLVWIIEHLFSFLKENTNTWYSHCDTCKQLGGGTYSLNQVLPKNVRDSMQTIKSLNWHFIEP